MGQTTKILLVEDEPSQRAVLEKKLVAEGFQVLTAMDGEEGLAKAMESRPDLILLDVVMPKMDGINVLRRLKANETTKDIPVIVLTNLNFANEELEGDQVEAYLVKTNWTLDDVLDKVKQVLEVE